MNSIRRRIRFIVPLAQVALAVALKAHNYFAPSTWEHSAGERLDNQFCDALNAPATLVRHLLRWTVPRLECLVFVPPRARFSNESCLGYLSQPVDLVLGTIVYFCLIWLVWYLTIIEAFGGGRGVLMAKAWMRKAADLLGVTFGLGLVVVGLLVRISGGLPTTYWNLVALPYYIWGAAIATFYCRDLVKHLVSST